VVCGADRAAVRLGGDATRIESGAVPDAQGLLDQISLERLERRAARKRSRR
jgi:hypothetical protein